MKKTIAIALAAFLIGGCAPKIGKEILIEPEGTLRLDTTGIDLLLGVLSVLGAPIEAKTIRIGSDLKITNHWHSDLKVVSLTYALKEGDDVFAEGNGKIGEEGFAIIPVGEEKKLPLVLRIDPERLTPQRLTGIYQGTRELMLQGDLVVEVWGWRKHYRFEKDATKLIEKALKKNGL
ncbi:MAG: hypothetical protein JXK04_08855 [Campylobacterales bacterium]|nr:hypothetical protein [Campylobacterales bacterium]